MLVSLLNVMVDSGSLIPELVTALRLSRRVGNPRAHVTYRGEWNKLRAFIPWVYYPSGGVLIANWCETVGPAPVQSGLTR